MTFHGWLNHFPPAKHLSLSHPANPAISEHERHMGICLLLQDKTANI